MRGKIGLVIGIGVGYVLGTRAGRERYEQIKAQALKVWNLEPVQKQVEKVKDAGKSAASALPRAVWDQAVKVTRSVRNTTADGLEPTDRSPEAALQRAREMVDEAEGPASNEQNTAGS